MLELHCDVHTHTIYSKHAFSTILENAEYAKQNGLELLGTTDHYSRMVNATEDLRDFQFFLNYSGMPRYLHDVLILKGCEADIIDNRGRFFGYDVPVVQRIDGSYYPDPTTLKEKVFSCCDYVVASVHDNTFTKSESKATNTEMYIKALQDEKTLVLGHIGRSGVDFELDPVLEAAKSMNKLVEINNSSLGSDTLKTKCRHIAERCAELGVHITVDSDAHIAINIGNLSRAKSMLEEIDFPQELIATTNKDTFLVALQKAGLKLL